MSVRNKSILLLAFCCGACARPIEEEKPKSHHVPPPVLPTGALCVLSADCQPGLHCDLGECVQDCNEAEPCGEGATCSARARCLAEGERDVDPPPSGQSLGVFSVAPRFVRLLPDATSFELEIATGRAEPVRFRATSSSPFVSFDVSHGTISGHGALSVTLAQSTAGAERSGSIEVFSELGSQITQFLQPAGVSGKYQGTMHYASGDTSLGDARLGLTLIHRNGDLDVVFDPQVSLLFPGTDAGPASGFGHYSEKEGMSFTVQQVLPADFGGARNSLGRALGRRLEVTLARAKGGIWSGKFKEKWFGLAGRAVELEGTMSLYYRPNEPVGSVETGGDRVLPAFEAPPTPWSSVLAGTGYQDCRALLDDHAGGGWLTDRAAALGKLLSRHARLDQTIANRFDDGRTYQDIYDACDAEFDAAQPKEKGICAWGPALGCGLLEAAGGAAGREPLPALFGQFYHALVAPVLLMAQQHAVRALDRSLAPGGLASERAEYTSAVARLAAPATWLLSPALLQELDAIATAAAGSEEAAARDLALEALGELLQLRTELEGEMTRLSASTSNQSQPALVAVAQERAVLGLIEAALINDLGEVEGPTARPVLLNGWLTPLDSAFGALLEGARAFGVPDGFVPFVWRAGDAGASNFEQMLALSNDSRLNEAALEDAYVQNQRAYEASEQALLEETLNVEASYGLELGDICGSDFRLGDGAVDWSACGKDDAGQFGVLLLQVEQADARVAASVSRLKGFRDKIEIDMNTLAQRQRIELATLSFISSTNSSINALKMTEGLLDVAMQAIEVAANSNLFNGGAPAAMAAASVIIGVQKVGIGVAQDELRQAQEMKVARQNVAIEELEGMASIKKATIDAAQLALEITQDSLAKQEAVARANGLLDHAKELARLMRRTSAVLARDPARNPAFRLVRDQRALALLDARARAQRLLYLAARALEYEVNQPIAGLAEAVLAARNGLAMTSLSSCLSEIHTSYRIAYGAPQHYVSEVSVREMLGVHGPRKDPVTGETSSAGEQFRALTQGSQAFDPDGSLLLTFATNLQPDNGLWAKDVCADRITGIHAQLVGDGLGDAEAQINLALSGAAVQRDCGSDELRVWSMSEGSEASSGLAVVQAGVNGYGEGEANRSLFGQSIARASWRLTIPSGDVAPSNADVDLDQLEDVLLRVEHQALPRRNTPLFVDTSCLSGLD